MNNNELIDDILFKNKIKICKKDFKEKLKVDAFCFQDKEIKAIFLDAASVSESSSYEYYLKVHEMFHLLKFEMHSSDASINVIKNHEWKVKSMISHLLFDDDQLKSLLKQFEIWQIADFFDLHERFILDAIEVFMAKEWAI